jgi:hypothetical protein
MPAVSLTQLEVKLLHLALNKAAAMGEIENSARMLISSWRQRGVNAAEIEQALSVEPLAIKPLRPDPGLTPMAWGKHRGKIIADVPPSVLRNAVRWARETPDVARKFAQFISDVEQFLQQGKN